MASSMDSVSRTITLKFNEEENNIVVSNNIIAKSVLEDYFPRRSNLKYSVEGKSFLLQRQNDNICLLPNIDSYEVILPRVDSASCFEEYEMDGKVNRKNALIIKKVKKLFAKGYSYNIILDLLQKKWNINLSLRTLSRILNELNLKRKNLDESEHVELVLAILLELEGSGFNLGYRAMCKRLKTTYNLIVKQETVRLLLREIDPEGVEGRCRYRLKRRVYSAPGPNYIWHTDNHDKLKRFGFPIYGCIDGFSKKIMWLRMSNTNNDPNVIGNYYLTAIEKYGLLPTLIRADKGTEATLMEDFHIALRFHHEDEFAGVKSFLRGKSTRNQRIESFWRQFRQRMGDFYIQLFKTMEEENLFKADNPLHVQCLRYCFGGLIETDIELTRKEWNQHRIRKQNNNDTLGGIPDELYKCPEKFGGTRYEKCLDLESLECLKEYVKEPSLVSTEFQELVHLLNIEIPEVLTAEDAFNLYVYILSALQKQLGEEDICTSM